jgi:superfamily I DNA and RNA helicase
VSFIILLYETKVQSYFSQKEKNRPRSTWRFNNFELYAEDKNILCLVGCYSTSNQNLVIQHAMGKGLFFMQQSELKHVNFHTL